MLSFLKVFRGDSLQARSFMPHLHLGERCSHGVVHHDGRPDNGWLFEIDAVTQEMNALEGNRLDPQLSKSEHADYMDDLLRMMKLAKSGRVRLTGLSPDGKVIDRTGFVIELRPRIVSSSLFGRKVRQLRLYFAEPEGRPRGLLALHLATKESSDEGYDEQDESIDEAVERGYAWAQAA